MAMPATSGSHVRATRAAAVRAAWTTASAPAARAQASSTATTVTPSRAVWIPVIFQATATDALSSGG